MFPRGGQKKNLGGVGLGPGGESCFDAEGAEFSPSSRTKNHGGGQQ